MNVCAIIPARYASSRFPGKPLIDLDGKSMIRRVYERVEECSEIQSVLVATDSEEILSHVQSFGGQAVLTGEHESGTSRCLEAAQSLSTPPDLIINVQGDEPCIDPKDLITLIGLFRNSSTQIGTLAAPMEKAAADNPNRVKVVFNQHNNALYFSRSVIPFERSNKPVQHFLHVGIYAFRTEVLNEICALPESVLERAESLEQLRWLDGGFSIQVGLTQGEPLAVDTPQDVEKVLAYIRSLEAEKKG